MAGDAPGPEGARPPDPFRREGVEFPGGADLIRQLAVVAVVVVAWGGLFRFAMGLPGAEVRTAERPERGPAAEAEASAGDSMDVRSEAAWAADSDAEEAASADAGVTVTPPAPTPSTSGAAADATASGVSGSTSAEPARSPSTTPAPASEPEPTDPEPRVVPAAGDPVGAIEREESRGTMPDLTDLPTVSFAADVMPIIERRCVKCHGAVRDDGTLRIEEGLDMRTWEGIMAGSTWGTVVEPGDPVASYMLELVLDGDMPDDGPRLLPREVRILTAWIAAGAEKN